MPLPKILWGLLPASLRPKPSLDIDQRTRLFATVNDHDPCLLAIVDRLQETLEAEFNIAIDPTKPGSDEIAGVRRMRISYWNLKLIEQDRAEAKAWKERNDGHKTTQ